VAEEPQKAAFEKLHLLAFGPKAVAGIEGFGGRQGLKQHGVGWQMAGGVAN